jgi:hypothetical protein
MLQIENALPHRTSGPAPAAKPSIAPLSAQY